LSDRIRYYWTQPDVTSAFNCLLANLGGKIPATLLTQFFPDLYPDIHTALSMESAGDTIHLRIEKVLDAYRRACSAR